MKNGVIEAGQSEFIQYEKIHYEVEISMQDSRIHNGITCTDYDKVDKSFGECIQNDVKETFISIYNCIPPWIPDNNGNETCEVDKKIQTPDKKNN